MLDFDRLQNNISVLEEIEKAELSKKNSGLSSDYELIVYVVDILNSFKTIMNNFVYGCSDLNEVVKKEYLSFDENKKVTFLNNEDVPEEVKRIKEYFKGLGEEKSSENKELDKTLKDAIDIASVLTFIASIISKDKI